MSNIKTLILEVISILSIAFIFSISAQAQEKLTVKLKNASMAQLAQEIQRQADYTFVYAEAVVKDVKINIEKKDASLSEIMTEALQGTGLKYSVTNRHIVIGRIKPSSDKEDKNKATRTISGYVKDMESRETLIGATAYCMETRQGVATNEYGFFSLTLPVDASTMHFSYIGYDSKVVALEDSTDISINILLQSNNRIAEVEVRADRPETGNASTRTGAVTVPVSYITQVPSLFSEPDVMRALQTLPGVQRGISGTSGIFVRGGGQEQNLFLLDGVSMYNVDHLFGFMSAFMPDAVKNVDFYKSAFPARYGGRLSSVVDVRTKDGDMQSYHGLFSLGLLSSHASLEGPIIKDKTSFCVSARRSYIDGVFALLSKIDDDDDLSALRPCFYDVNAKLNHIFSDTDRLFASFYIGRDSYRYEISSKSEHYVQNGVCWEPGEGYVENSIKLRAKWGNILGALRWNHIYSPRLFSNTTVAYNIFNFNLNQNSTSRDNDGTKVVSSEGYESRFESGISDVTFIHDLDFHPIPSHHLRMGAQYVIHRFLPEVKRGRIHSTTDEEDPESPSTFDSDGEKSIGHDISIYADDDVNLTDKLQVILGVRASLFAVEGKVYPAVEPRFSTCYKMSDLWRVKASYAMMHQYVHLLSSMPISLPTDLWVPVSKNIKPMNSDQVSFGIYTEAVPTCQFSVEGYYKWMNNILDFKDGANFNGNTSAGWQRLVESGRGISRGVEVSAKRTEGSVTGQISYTWSKTEHKFGPELNAGRWFPFKYDRRHVLNIVGQWAICEKVDVGAQWSYASGACMSVPDKLIRLKLPDPNDGNYADASDIAVCSSRNNYRLAPTHTLDININFHRQLKHCSRTLSFSVMNVYVRHNQDVVYASQQDIVVREDGTLRPEGAEILPSDSYAKETVLYQTTLIPFLPSFSYSIKF